MRLNLQFFVDIKQDFNLELSNRFEALSDLMEEAIPLEQCWEHTKNVWKQTSEIVLGRKTRQNKEWISVDTLLKIKERKTCKTVINNSKTRATKAAAQQKYNEKNKEVKSSIKKDRKNFIDNLAKEAEDAASKMNMKEVYNITGKLARGQNEYEESLQHTRKLVGKNEQQNSQ